MDLIFGAAARTWSARVTLPRDTIVADASEADAALAAAFTCKRAGRMFRAAFILPEERAEVAALLVPRILTAETSRAACDVTLDALANGTLTFEGRLVSQLRAGDPVCMAALGLIWWLADGVIARSRAEYERYARLFGRVHTNVAIVAGIDSLRHVAGSGVRDSVVIWAPERSAADCALIVYALESLHAPVRVVCAEGSIGGLRATFHQPTEGYRLLADARAIVDASWSDPATARGLAQRGIPLVVASTSGAQEYLVNVAVYDPWDRTGILRAVMSTLGAAPPQARVGHVRDAAALNAPPIEGPLVTVLVPTHNRRDYLRRALASVQAQRYRCLDVIVINDAGEAVGDIVAEFAEVRCVVQPRNGGRGAALNAGLRHARGEYVTYLDDDDEFFPDHIGGMVAALEISRLDVAYVNPIVAFMRDAETIEGLTLGTRRGFAPSEALIGFPFKGQFLALVRRKLLEEIGGFSEDIAPAEDYDFFLRLLARTQFVHLPGPSALYMLRSDNSNMSRRDGALYAQAIGEIFRRHPSGGRMAIDMARVVFLNYLAAHQSLPPTLVEYRFATPIML